MKYANNKPNHTRYNSRHPLPSSKARVYDIYSLPAPNPCPRRTATDYAGAWSLSLERTDAPNNQIHMNSYTKLKDGSWGLRIEGTATKGQSVTIQTKSGERKTEVVGNVLWTGPDNRTKQTISLCEKGSLATTRSPRKHTRPGGRYECEECGEWVTPGTQCWETGLAH